MTTANPTVPAGSTQQWRDRKRYLWLIGLVVPSLAFIGAGMHALTGWGVWFWIGPIVILVVVPAIDLVAGLDRSNPPDDVIEALEQDRYYRWITYLFLPIQYAGFLGAFWLISTGDLSVGRQDRAWRSRSAASAGSASTPPTSSATSARATSAGCPRSPWRRASTGTSTSSTTAATTSGWRPPRTRPAAGSARASTQFWPRTVIGSLRSRVGAGEAPDRAPQAAPVPARQRRAQRLADVGGALGRDAGWRSGSGSCPTCVIQAVVGFSLLEVVNYMEHYGMRRNRTGADGTGRYERVDPSHSWNSNNIATNVLLYHLQRHSDHHANPTRRYQTLRDFQESPVLPTGYAGMIVLALVPAGVAPGDGPAGARPLRRRHQPGQHQPAQARPGAGGVPPACVSTPEVPRRSLALAPRPRRRPPRCSPRAAPAAATPTTSTAGEEREGFAAGTAWTDIPDAWCCPDCGVRDKVDFVTLTEAA